MSAGINTSACRPPSFPELPSTTSGFPRANVGRRVKHVTAKNPCESYDKRTKQYAVSSHNPLEWTRKGQSFWLRWILHLGACIHFLMQTLRLFQHAQLCPGFQAAFSGAPIEEEALKILSRDLPVLLVIYLIVAVKAADLLNMAFAIWVLLIRPNVHMPIMTLGWRIHSLLFIFSGFCGPCLASDLPFWRLLSAHSVYNIVLLLVLPL